MQKRRPVSIVSLLAALVFLAAYGALGSAVARHARDHDFGAFYMGASLVRDGHFAQLYDYSTQTARWRQLIPGDDPAFPYIRPPFYAAIQSVIAVVPLPASYWICTSGSILLVLGCWAWFGRKWGEDHLILAAMFLPVVAGIAHGQDIALVLALVTASFWLHDRGKLGLAGAVLALALFKFHLLLLIGPLLLFTRRWRMFQGFAIVAAVEAAASLALAGVPGIQAYIALMLRRDLATLYPMPEKMPNLTGLFANFQWTSAPLLTALFLTVLGLAFFTAYQAPWWRVYLSGGIASLLVVPHVFMYDATLLLPALLYCYTESPSKLTRAACAWLCCPLASMAVFFGPPWPALLPVSYLFLLAALAQEARQKSAVPALVLAH